MDTVGTREAAKLLRICTQRVLQLIYEGRIKGAKKVGRFWQIPIYGKKPRVSNCYLISTHIWKYIPILSRNII
ncbi:MAG: helix-turn-helix domain-containing protein [Rivularia sp. ALOHA_DT_140]|nr:helix-turn-helix domain-containing protein [Rivularia sp. ALOHA_DT_140]